MSWPHHIAFRSVNERKSRFVYVIRQDLQLTCLWSFARQGFIYDNFLQILFSMSQVCETRFIIIEVEVLLKFIIIGFRQFMIRSHRRGCQQPTISYFHLLINNTHNSCQRSHSKSVVPGMNEWWRELKTESPQNKVRCSELLLAKRSIKYGAFRKLQNWYGIAR